MKTKQLFITFAASAVCLTGLFLMSGCKKSGSESSGEGLPAVTTTAVTNVTDNSATCGGNVTSEGSSPVTMRGVLWAVTPNLTFETATQRTSDGSGTGTFTSTISGLTKGTTYYVRAYAVNSNGAGYGNEYQFTAGEGGGGGGPDLSANGTANCYVVSSQGEYYFNATVKGGGTESVGTPASAEVLWESFGTDVKPQVGDIVNNVSYSEGKVKFTSGQNGNAVIAVKDASGTILWSWHIWVCQGFDPKTTAQVYNNNAGTMMDRNLGATSATPGDVHSLGLLYQWGRKDPFLGGCHISYTVEENQEKAASTISWPSAEQASSHLSGNNTLSFAVSHPTTFIASKSLHDWYCTIVTYRNDNLWKSTEGAKTMYDPCPTGWRVPDGGEIPDGGIWSRAFNYSDSWDNASNWDGINRGMDFAKTDKKLGSGVVWYPAAGHLSNKQGELDYVGEVGNYWSCTPASSGGSGGSQWITTYDFDFACDGGVQPSFDDEYRIDGYSVRCVRDASSPTPSVSVTTSNVTSITSTSAVCGGTVNGSATVTARGVVWNTSQTPTLESCTGKTTDGSGIGAFTSNITGLTKGITYYVRAYATSSDGQTAYGDQKSFKAEEGGGSYPEAPGLECVTINGIVWAPVNCGYDATNYPYGKLYQWGRKYGQGYNGNGGNDGDYPGKSGGNQSLEDISKGALESHPDGDTYNGKFYYKKENWYGGTSPEPDKLWNSNEGTSDPVSKTAYDPCPEGWRVPTYSELNALTGNSGGSSIGSAGWDSAKKGYWFNGTKTPKSGEGLFLPAAGGRHYGYGTAVNRDSYGYYWSSNGSDASFLAFFNGNASMSNYYRAFGYSVRCVKE